MRTLLRRMGLAIATVIVCGSPALAQVRAEVSGRWVLETPVTPTLERLVPAWEEIEADVATVSLRRATRSDAAETYLADDLDREVRRVATQPRTCRTTWEERRLVIACRQPGGGPGGFAPPIATREVRYVDTAGRLVVELTWRSGERTVTDRRIYRRDVQP